MNLSADDVQKMKVVELRAELTTRGLDNRGVKAVLTERLIAALQSTPGGGVQIPQSSPSFGNDFSISAPVPHHPSPRQLFDQLQQKIPEIGSSAAAPLEASPVTSPVRSTTRNQTPPRSQFVDQVSTSPIKTVQPPSSSPNKLVSTPPPVVSPVKPAVVIPTPSPLNSEASSVLVTPAVTSSPAKSPTKVSSTSSPTTTTPTVELTQVTSSSGSPSKVQGVVESSSTSEQPESSQNQDSSLSSNNKQEEQIETVTTSADGETVAKDESMDVDKDGETNKRKLDDVNGDVEEDKREQNKRVKTEPEPKIIPENEPEFDADAVLLDWFMSDLNLKISTDNFLEAEPWLSDEFPFAYAAAKATYGFTSGKLYYEVKWVDSKEVKQDLGEGENKHVLRFGWSDLEAGLQLGVDKISYGWDSSGKIFKGATVAEDFGETFDKDDVVGVCLNLDDEEKIELKFVKNGTIIGSTVEIPKADLEGKALFPHILTRNVKFQVNFGSTDPVYNSLENGFTLVGKIEPSESRVRGPVRPASKEECEMIMVIGLAASGKTKWSKEYVANNSDKYFNILGTSTIVERSIQDPTVITKNANRKFDGFFQKAGKFIEKLIEIAPSRRRNYILDQSNVVAGAQRRKSGGFKGFIRRAVVIVPSDEEYQKRIKAKEQEQGKSVPKSTILDMKATFRLPEVGEIFSVVDFPELDNTESQKLVTQYNKEGVSAGYGKPIPSRGGARGRGGMSRPGGGNRGHRGFRGGGRRGSGGPPRIPRGMPMPLRGGRGGPPPRGGPPSRIPRHIGGMGSGGGGGSGPRGGGNRGYGGGGGSAIPTRASHQSSYQSRNSRGSGGRGGGSWRGYGPGGGGGGGGGGRYQQQYPHGGMQNWGGPGNWGQQSNRGGGFGGGGGGFPDPWQQHQQVPDQGFGQSWDSSGGSGAMGRNSGGNNMGNWNKGSGSTWYGYGGQTYGGYGSGGGRR